MNEFKLIMKDGAGHQRMVVGRSQPAQKVVHQYGYTLGWRCHVQNLSASHDAHAAAAVMAGLINKPGHKNAVGGQQVMLAVRTPFFKPVISGNGVFGPAADSNALHNSSYFCKTLHLAVCITAPL
jgi:hypothetical protein